MSSDVEICNLALGFLGDDANVSSIDPPEGSDQADHCAQFYPIARDLLLEMFPWRFSATRIIATQVPYDFTEWQYAYALPINALKVFAVLPVGATSDYSADISQYQSAYLSEPFINVSQVSALTPQDFDQEVLPDGSQIIVTNVPTPTLRYALRITDTTKFPALFVVALARLLAAFLAGPIIKGEVGAKMSQTQLQFFQLALGQAMLADAMARQVKATFTPAGIQVRL